jgi:hypothetical protein
MAKATKRLPQKLPKDDPQLPRLLLAATALLDRSRIASEKIEE